MLQKFVQEIISLAKAETFQINGQTYTDGNLRRVPPHVDRPESIKLNGLDSICKIVRDELHKFSTTIFIQVDDFDHVNVMTSYLEDFSRNHLYSARADVPGIKKGWRDRETLLIELRSLFIPNEGTGYLLDLLSKMTNENNVSSTGNGVTQTVEARQGIALNAKVQVKPKVELIPFRTFLEVSQPSSEFLIRVNENGEIGLFEADGGVWKLEAKRNIMTYLETALKDLIEAGKIIVMM